MEIIIRLKEELNNINDQQSLRELKPKYLGKKGLVQEMMQDLSKLSIEEKKELGQKINSLKDEINILFESKEQELFNKFIEEKEKNEKIDVTLPSTKTNFGTIHPLTQTINELINIFTTMGYEIKEGPEIETDEYCFEMLNLPKHHPARDQQDTFYIDVKNLLRSQTSPVQVRTMLEKNGKDIKIICPGKTYRRDSDDQTHSHQFMQCEGLVLGKDISLANLKHTLLYMMKKLLGENTNIRLRPSYFPFTEPSVEVDVTCVRCKGSGCSMCKNTGYIEVLGAGMVNENVLRMSGYDPDKISGFAFGIGIERITMLKYGIEDIRNFYTNDIKFLKMFKEKN